MPSVNRVITFFQLVHLIEVPLTRIYPENRPKPPFNFTSVSLEEFFKNGDLAQYFNQLRRYSSSDTEDDLLESLDFSESRSYQPSRYSCNDFETIKNSYYLGNLTLDQKQRLVEFLTHLDAIRREQTRKQYERSIIYKDFISLFEIFGLSGKDCLLHTICEIAESPFQESLMGDIFNVLMTPSSGSNAKFLPFDPKYNEYLEAEAEGKQNGDCDKKYNKCSIPFFIFVENILQSMLNV
ncbi:hypothetical protein Avbf_00006 [Armadillidium vulgare]|nr:hypothetical protein Avbf_00006 [Armadillidium vulgare]